MVKTKRMHPEITYNDLDWHVLWQNARAKKSWTAKGSADWDKKAKSFAKRNSNSPFVDLVLKHIPIGPQTTVLDGGSGPGTLSLPLAATVKSVTAIDYSKGMLDVLKNRAQKLELNNIRTILSSWEDDWEALQINKHDICIACRSLSVNNLKDALTKLNDYATRAVYVIDRINPTPFDNGAFQALNRPFRSGPDYIYTINTLYSMNIHPGVSIISLGLETHFNDMEAALESYRWMFKDLTEKDEQTLTKYIAANSRTDTNGDLILKRSTPQRWALIWWEKES
jgi:SAM-dependent methyltransferase